MAKRIVAESSWIASDFRPETFNRLTSISSIYKPKGAKQALQDFVCDCGALVTKPRVYVTHGNCSSCGCLKKDITTARNKASAKHGYFGTPTYRSWSAMVTRCEDPTHMAYHNYGGRGVTIDPLLRDFIGFLSVMGERPSIEHSIDRYPNKNGNYEPGNCRWATRKEQLRNTRSNKIIEHRGKSQCATAWAEEYNLSISCLVARINAGWDVEEALTTPSGTVRNSRQGPQARKAKGGATYTHNGETLTIYQWEQKVGINGGTINARIKAGWPIDKALTTPVKPRKPSRRS